MRPASIPDTASHSPEQRHPRKPRQRSSIACQSCNSRRVKCNAASGGLPCSNCQRSGRDCRLIVSRRGKRKSKSAAATAIDTPTSAPVPTVPPNDTLDPNNIPDDDDTLNGPEKPSENVQLQTQTAEESRITSHSVNIATALGEPVAGDGLPESQSNGQNGIEGPEMLYAQMLEADKPRGKQRKLMKPGGQVVYLGETFNLTYLLQQNSPEEPERRHRLHYPMPIDNTKDSPDTRTGDRIGLLEIQKAFELPSSDICRELFRAYFKHVQPHYPITDRELFLIEYDDPQNPPSWLLLQAVLFMAAGHCEESLLKSAGFKSRYDARLTLFNRTKALYDADHDTNKVTIVQAVFLMSFWWATPVDSKDTWHWLGISISLALTIGMHRSTKNSGMSLKDQRLWKKIWWSLFTEDKHAAAALGRPVHIRLSDCDVEPLEVSDFDGEAFGTTNPHDLSVPKVHVCYVIFLSSLSKIVERIIEKSSHASGSRNNSLELCEGMLQVWETGFPEELRLDSDKESIWPSMLHIAAW